MKRAFKSVRFKSDSLERINRCNEIIEDYQAQGLRLTLRQLYYQLVTKNIIPNVEKSYKNLSSLVSDARLAGLMDWDAIEDRVRVPRRQNEWRDIPHLVDSALRAYRLPRWETQYCYVELWVEKDALAGVLAPIASKYHITLMVNRGYSSQSAMYESALRFLDRQGGAVDDTGERYDYKPAYLLYLGDHDPSGEDMVRDVADRLEMFGAHVSVSKVALTIEQVREYDPPPNPAKVSDPRAKNYIAEHGNESWEVDALPPEVLTSLIEEQLDRLVDRKLMDKVIKREDADKQRLREMVRG